MTRNPEQAGGGYRGHDDGYRASFYFIDSVVWVFRCVCSSWENGNLLRIPLLFKETGFCCDSKATVFGEVSVITQSQTKGVAFACPMSVRSGLKLHLQAR